MTINRVALNHEPRSRLFPIAALIALIFMVKFSVYAWMVTPLWDIPDESGHYSYVLDVSHGEWPLLGAARMDKQVMRSWINPTVKRQGTNWIAQHPPLFYALDAPVLMAAQAAGLDFEHQVRAARLPAALFGSLTLLGLALFLARATGRDELGLAGAIFLGATPMFTHMSTGVSHDTLVACTAAWAAYWVMRWLESNHFRHLLYAGAMVALCTVSKITGLAMAVPLFFALAWKLWRVRSAGEGPRAEVLQWAVRSMALWLLMFVPVCLWIARNLSHFGQIFPDASNLHPIDTIPIGFFEFMTRFPVWQHILLNFIALVGWNGSGNGVLHWIPANGGLARYFLAFLGAGSLGAVLAPAIIRLESTARHALAAGGLLIVIVTYLWWPLLHLVQWTCMLLFAAVAATLAANARAFWRGDGVRWLLATGAACIIFFLLAYYETLRNDFAGSMRATHGRYLYPVVPFLMLALLWPFRGRVARGVLLCAAVVAMIFADGFFLHQVFGMYGQLPA